MWILHLHGSRFHRPHQRAKADKVSPHPVASLLPKQTTAPWAKTSVWIVYQVFTASMGRNCRNISNTFSRNLFPSSTCNRFSLKASQILCLPFRNHSFGWPVLVHKITSMLIHYKKEKLSSSGWFMNKKESFYCFINTDVKGVLHISQVSCPSLPMSLEQQSNLLLRATPWRFLHSEFGVYLSHSSWLQPHCPETAHSLCALLAFQLWGLPRGLIDCKTPDLQASQEPAEIVSRSPRANTIWGLLSSVRHALLAWWGAEDTSRQAAVTVPNPHGVHPFYLITWDCMLQ